RIERSLPAAVRRACSFAIVRSYWAVLDRRYSWKELLTLLRRSNLFGCGGRLGRRRGLNSLARPGFSESCLFERFSLGLLFVNLIHVHHVCSDTSLACRSFVAFVEHFFDCFHRVA